MVERVPITMIGYERLKKRLKLMKGPERRAIVEEIETARAHGDLSENAEYHAAKEKQGIMEAQIRNLEDKLSRAEVINVAALSGNRVVFGATVTVYDVDKDEEAVYQIVGDEETDNNAGKISLNSPIARAVLGKFLDDEATVQTPRGVRHLEIIDIKFVP